MKLQYFLLAGSANLLAPLAKPSQHDYRKLAPDMQGSRSTRLMTTDFLPQHRGSVMSLNTKKMIIGPVSMSDWEWT